ncbi:putative kinase [Acidovorax sp. 62]|uniref:AAA family ATPase n=1 Tax=Acidovorax sp. 62 TaxID=2035203 RepID=UPI000C42B74B|nr:AAA family ATPase [Acidovorax sp. 62]PIF93382.1 putative kinase [Acidovorax sp. 62]
MAPLMMRVAPYAVLRKLLPLPGQDLDWALCCEAIEALRVLDTTPQDPVHHAEGDVGTHTRWVIACLREDATFQQALLDRQWVMFMAALLHDIAKPATTVVDEATGRIRQPGHSQRGAVDARVLLWLSGCPWELREAICRLIAVHQQPFFVWHSHRGTPPEYVVRKLSWELRWSELLAVARADMRGRVCQDQASHLEDLLLLEELVREEGAWDRPRHFADVHTALQYFRGTRLYPDEPLHPQPGSRVTVMCGLPASGKNHWVGKHRPDLPVVSFDDAREALGLAHGDNEGKVAHQVWDQARALLRAQAPFVWNATHLSHSMRDKTLDLLYAYHAQVDIVHLEQPLPELLRRNQRRDTTLTNAALLRMLHRWEAPLPTEAHHVVYGDGVALPTGG